jgi:hypothetical protein
MLKMPFSTSRSLSLISPAGGEDKEGGQFSRRVLRIRPMPIGNSRLFSTPC